MQISLESDAVIRTEIEPQGEDGKAAPAVMQAQTNPIYLARPGRDLKRFCTFAGHRKALFYEQEAAFQETLASRTTARLFLLSVRLARDFSRVGCIPCIRHVGKWF
jgi:hypothetical protein